MAEHQAKAGMLLQEKMLAGLRDSDARAAWCAMQWAIAHCNTTLQALPASALAPSRKTSANALPCKDSRATSPCAY